MMLEDRIQTLIHKFDVEGIRRLNYLALTLMVVALAVWYDTHCYHNFNSPEAMDAAQVARNLAEGNGFTTEYIRPFSIFLLQQHNRAAAIARVSGTNAADAAEVQGRHPDLANAPLYPAVLAGIFKVIKPDWKVEMRKPFWADGGRFQRYKPEFIIAIFNQLLLLAAVLLTFLVAKTILDTPAAWLSSVLMLCSDELWKFSVSGLPTLLLLVIFLGLVWCLASFEVLGRAENPEPRRRLALVVFAGLLTGLGMLTRYSFGWLIVPVVVFFAIFGGQRRAVLAATAFLVLVAVVSPWLARNYVVSGTPFGTAGFALMENSEVFPGSRLAQSLSPDMFDAYHDLVHLTLVKLMVGLPGILRDDLPRLGGGWVGILFLAGLLLGLRNVVVRRLRYFTLMCLGVLVVFTALGRTPLSDLSPDINTENLLVLLMPVAVIFGVAFFLTLLNQMDLSFPPMRYVVIALVLVLMRLQFALTLLPPKTKVSAYPPYYPPEIQQVSGWMRPDELMMSDVPWAVAWYGDRQCTCTTLNSQYEFFQLNDYVKPVRALYLTLNTLDGRLWTDCLEGGVDSWGLFALRMLGANQVPPQFPLQAGAYGLHSGLFLTDHQRWESQ